MKLLLFLLILLKLVLSQDACLGAALPCAKITSDTQLWGRTTRGIDFTKTGYAQDIGDFTLVWVGCPSDGCAPSHWYCTDQADGIEFGASASVLRSLMGKYASATDFPQAYQRCAEQGDEWSVHNAPMQDASAKQMCRELGYKDGQVILKHTSNYCPEPEYNPTKQDWETDLVWSSGYGQKYKCTGKCDTVAPVAIPAPTAPVMLVDNVCELIDIDFFLKECSKHHNGLVSNLGTNDAADVVLKGRVDALETKTAADKTTLQTQIDGLQTQVTNLINTIKTQFDNLATSLGPGPAAKTVPIFNDNGEIIGQEKLFFTAIQAQWMIVLSIGINCLFLIGLTAYCFVKFIISSGKKKTKI